MPPTLGADITIVPEEFLPHVIEYSTKLSALVQAGIVIPDPVFDAEAKKGGKLIDMPFWKDVDDDSQVIDDTVDTTINPIDQSGDIAVKLMRENAWGASDLSAALAGSDPVDSLAQMIGGYWAREEQRVLMYVLNGVFADNLANFTGDLIYDASVADIADATYGNYLSGEVIIDAKSRLGDAHGKLTAIAMHSVPYHNLEKLGLVKYIQTISTDGTTTTTSVAQGEPNLVATGIPTVFGRRVVVDDTLPAVAVTGGYKYTSYLFGAGAIARGEGTPKHPFEMARVAKRGITEIYHRRNFILHPRGVKFLNASVAKQSPTNAELALAANWSRVWEKKNIRIVKLVTNG
jgi:hypothetical protein